MTKKTYGIIGLGLLMFIFTMWGMFKVSKDDINTQEVLRAEKVKVEETLSGLNLQLSGYSSGWLEQEKIIIEAKKKQKLIEEKANTIRYRSRIYENKLNGYNMILGTGVIKELEKELKLPPVEKTSFIPKVSAAYTPTTGTIMIKGFPEDSLANLIANKVYKEIGLDMVLTLIGENGTFRIDRKSMMIGSNGYSDYGLCQLNYQYHKKFIDSPDFQNREKQVEYCMGVRNDAVKKNRLETTFYAFNHRLKYQDRIIYK